MIRHPVGEAKVVSNPVVDRSRALRASALLALGLGVMIVVGLLLLGQQSRSPLLVAGLLISTGICGLLINRDWMANVCLFACSVTVTIYVVEACAEAVSLLAGDKERRLRSEYSAAHDTSFDSRSQLEFLQAMRARGHDLYPAFPRGLLLQRDGERPTRAALIGADGNALVPLGSISNVETVRGNETGQFLVYVSDERGFHNPRGIWPLRSLQVAAIGDSFVFGESVPSGSNMVASIRSYLPRTLNLGDGGNGPLSELGTILEYLPERQPQLVLWFYTEENDLPEDLEREKRSPVMMDYLQDPPKIQNLETRQAEVDAKLRVYFEQLFRSPPSTDRFGHFLNLSELSAIFLRLWSSPPEDFDLFKRVLEAAKRAVSPWHGRLVFVYVPVRATLMPGIAGSSVVARSAEHHKRILQICSDLSIPVIDLHERFAADASHLTDYFYPYEGHLTPSGYQRAGNVVIEELRAKALIPTTE